MKDTYFTFRRIPCDENCQISGDLNAECYISETQKFCTCTTTDGQSFSIPENVFLNEISTTNFTECSCSVLENQTCLCSFGFEFDAENLDCIPRFCDSAPVWLLKINI